MVENNAGWLQHRPSHNSSRAEDWPLDVVLAQKKRRGATVSVILAASEADATTIGANVEAVRGLMEADELGLRLVDEVVVAVVEPSAGGTVAAADLAGAVVVGQREIAGRVGRPITPGKGLAMLAGALGSSGHYLVFLDEGLHRSPSGSDHEPDELIRSHITGLLGPALNDPNVHLVSPAYRRAQRRETVPVVFSAKTVLAMVSPELGAISELPAHDCLVTRALVTNPRLPAGAAVDVALLFDALVQHGFDAIAQVEFAEPPMRRAPHPGSQVETEAVLFYAAVAQSSRLHWAQAERRAETIVAEVDGRLVDIEIRAAELRPLPSMAELWYAAQQQGADTDHG